ncbi:MAG: type I polyketide synthase [Candidatus Binatia bacterium]|nr:type I polyketide synthase [Candidatus Binatia bacterium]
MRGSAVNQDGRSAGLTAPSQRSQQRVIEQALASAGAKPEEISYVEAHGTGTPLGDPIEIEALTNVVGRPREDGSTCKVGSVKTNFGHLEAAAGVAGLIKVALSLRHREIPPHLNFQQLNPGITFENTPFEIPTALEPWEPAGDRRLGGVSSFGFSGTNAHVILEEAPKDERPTASAEATSGGDDAPHVLVLSGHGSAALSERARTMSRRLRTPDAKSSLGDICFTASRHRTHHTDRLAVVGEGADEIADKLDAFADAREQPGLVAGRVRSGAAPRIAFVFPGQGSQWRSMGLELYEHEPVFRAALDDCARAIQQHAGWDLLREIRGEDRSGIQSGQVDVVQPALFSIQVALATFWRSLGIEPDVVVGHSMGEVAAAHIAGALSLDDATRVICERSRLVRTGAALGGMMVVELSLDEARAAIETRTAQLAVAASNGPRSSILSGRIDALDAVQAELEGKQVFCRRVKVDYASHSPQMDGLLPDVVEALSDLQPGPTNVPFLSTVRGDVTDGAQLDGAYWARNLREPVLFWNAIEKILERPPCVLLEVSPHPVLLPGVADALRGEEGATIVTSLRRDQPERAVLRESLAALHCAGVEADWERIYPSGRCVALPTYPWQRERYWLDESLAERNLTLTSPGGGAGGVGTAAGHPLLGHGFASAQGAHVFEVAIGLETHAYLADHRVEDKAWLPAAAYTEMALAAAANVGDDAPRVDTLTFETPLILPDDGVRTLQVVLSPDGEDHATVEFFTRLGEEDGFRSTWTRHAHGRVQWTTETAELAAPSLEAMKVRCADSVEIEEFYEALAATGLEYGPRFRGVKELYRGVDEALGRIELSESEEAEASAYGVHPALLDAAFQVFGATFTGAERIGTYLPATLEHVRRLGTCGSGLWAHARLVEGEPGSSEELSAEVRLLNGAGELVMEVGALRARRFGGASEKASWEDWLYRLEWRAEERTAGVADTERGTWIVLGDSGRRGEIEAGLVARGQEVLSVGFGGGYARTVTGYQIDPTRPEDYQQFLRDAFSNGRPACRGVLHLCDDGVDDLTEAQRRGVGSVLHLVQALAHIGWRDAPRLWLVTCGAQAVESSETVPGLSQAPLWGLGKVVALEHPELRCTRLDLDPADAGVPDALIAELLADMHEDEIALRGSQRYVHRLSTAEAEAPAETPRGVPEPAGDRPFRLLADDKGVLDDITLCEVDRPAPGPGQVEIEIRAAGLNFRDVLLALDAVPPEYQDEGPVVLGRECSGVVSAVGADVTDVAVGDEVVTVAPGCFARYVLAPAAFAVPKPSGLSFEEAASVPLVFMTAHYGLNHLARIRAGERVLIHAAAGGVGQAAVQLAQRAGAEVFATAGSEAKRTFLREQGIAHVMDSRTLAFADEVMAATDGQGVDVVLNSLAGEAMEKSLDTLGPCGRFVEIGIRDILDNRSVGLLPFQRGLSYAAVQLAALAVDRPPLFASLLRETMDGFETGGFSPIPMVEFGLGDAHEAFRFMAQAKHIGKVVLTAGDPSKTPIVPASGASGAALRPDATYLITGGLGGLGMEVAGWMAERGARDLILLGRSGPGEAARDGIARLRAAGVTVRVARGDVSKIADMRRVWDEMADGPPLRGVIHAAGVLDDGMLLGQTAERFAAVMAPKVAGARNLHELTRDQNLDVFVLFSSAAALLGSPGQGNYVAANSYLDALAHHRRAAGLPGLSINWGAWSDVGLVAAESRRRENVGLRGVQSLSPTEALEALGRILPWAAPQIGVMPLNLRQWFQSFPKTAELPLMAELAAAAVHVGKRPRERSALETALRELESVEARQSLLASSLRHQVGLVLRLDPERIEMDCPLTELGLDSLMALELRNRLETNFGVELSATMAFNYPTIATLAPVLGQKMGVLEGLGPVRSEMRDAIAGEDPGGLQGFIEELQDMSEDEVEAQLEQELGALAS